MIFDQRRVLEGSKKQGNMDQHRKFPAQLSCSRKQSSAKVSFILFGMFFLQLMGDGRTAELAQIDFDRKITGKSGTFS